MIRRPVHALTASGRLAKKRPKSAGSLVGFATCTTWSYRSFALISAWIRVEGHLTLSQRSRLFEIWMGELSAFPSYRAEDDAAALDPTEESLAWSPIDRNTDEDRRVPEPFTPDWGKCDVVLTKQLDVFWRFPNPPGVVEKLSDDM